MCAYEVVYGEEKLIIAHNFSGEAVTVALPKGDYKLAEKINAADNEYKLEGNNLTLPAYGTGVINC